MAELHEFEHVHVVASCREFEFTFDPRIKTIDAKRMSIGLLSSGAPRAHGIGGEVRLDLIRTAQSLRLLLNQAQ